MAQTTKKAIAASLKQLLARKPLSKITIADIAEDCGINRMTFYYHFQDIYDLIAWICQEEGGRALEGHKDYRTWQEGFAALCRTVVDNRAFVEGVYRSVQREQIERYLVGAVFGLLLPVVEERECFIWRWVLATSLWATPSRRGGTQPGRGHLPGGAKAHCRLLHVRLRGRHAGLGEGRFSRAARGHRRANQPVGPRPAGRGDWQHGAPPLRSPIQKRSGDKIFIIGALLMMAPAPLRLYNAAIKRRR